MSAKGSVLSVRIEPEMRWALELLAREQFRSVTGVVQSAVKAYASEMVKVARDSYHPDAGEQAKRLADLAPHLLTFDEREFVRDGGAA